MSEKKKSILGTELNGGELDNVSGGFGVFIPVSSLCPMCKQNNIPVWSDELNRYVCPNQACRCPRSSSNPTVHVLP